MISAAASNSLFVVAKSGIIDNILSWAKFKEGQLLKKTDGSKRERVSGISKLDDANLAGTKESQTYHFSPNPPGECVNLTACLLVNTGAPSFSLKEIPPRPWQ